MVIFEVTFAKPHYLCVLCKQNELPMKADFKCPAPYCGGVLATTKVLVQDFVHNLNYKSCPSTFVATKSTCLSAKTLRMGVYSTTHYSTKKLDDKKLEQTAILHQNRALFTNHLISPNESGGSTLGQIKLRNR